MKIHKEDACNFLLRYQSLTGSQPIYGVDGILEYLKKVGCIQYDPLNIVGRNADLVLQSRIMNYKPKMLEQLLYKDRLLIDGWDKMMSIYPREDWPYFRFVREKRGIEAISTLKYRNSSDALLHTDVVLEALAQNGPMLPKQIQLGSANVGRWGHRNLSSATLDYLFHIGKVGVFKKVNVTKVYDLIENLLPAHIFNQPNPFESEYELCKWYVYRRLGSVGMLWNKDGGGWLATHLGDKNLRQRILDEHVADGLIQCIEIEGISDKFYIRSKDASLLNTKSSTTSEAVRFIAPLDNLLWDRGMLSKLFNFNYTWEVYVPVAKRKYGYYVLPVLYGNRFIARFEPIRRHGVEPLRFCRWWWEEGVDITPDLIEAIESGLFKFASYLGADGIDHSCLTLLR